jgi:hypothetical protein
MPTMSVKLGDGMRWIGLSTTDTEFALLKLGTQPHSFEKNRSLAAGGKESEI